MADNVLIFRKSCHLWEIV